MERFRQTRNPVIVTELASQGVSLASALRSGGYPESIARHPDRYWDNKSFLNFLHSYFEMHPEELERFASSLKKGLDTTNLSGLPDHRRRLFFSSIALKIKGYL
jgi:hypothetical protein